MKNEKKLTKAQAQMLDNYNNADNSGELWQVYGNYSRYKAQAQDRIKNEMLTAGGYGLRITAHNSNFFSIAYRLDTENGTQLVYHTPTKRHIFYI